MSPHDHFDGGCRCGAVRYRCDSEPFIVVHCHCRDCQYMSGTAYSTFVCIPRNKLDVTGALNRYAVGEPGDCMTWNFCPVCGTPVVVDLEVNPGTGIVLAGSLDDPSWLQPEMHVYTSLAQPWEHADGIPRYAEGAPD